MRILHSYSEVQQKQFPRLFLVKVADFKITKKQKLIWNTNVFEASKVELSIMYTNSCFEEVEVEFLSIPRTYLSQLENFLKLLSPSDDITNETRLFVKAVNSRLETSFDDLFDILQLQISETIRI